MRDPDGYLIEVGEYSQTSLDHFRVCVPDKEKDEEEVSGFLVGALHS